MANDTARFAPGDRVLEMVTVEGIPATVVRVELAADGTAEYWIRRDSDDPAGDDDWPCSADELRPMAAARNDARGRRTCNGGDVCGHLHSDFAPNVCPGAREGGSGGD